MTIQESDIEKIYFEHQHSNWDGYDAVPITLQSKNTALAFINSLAACPSPDGGIGFVARFGGKTLDIEIIGNDINIGMIDQ